MAKIPKRVTVGQCQREVFRATRMSLMAKQIVDGRLCNLDLLNLDIHSFCLVGCRIAGNSVCLRFYVAA